MSAEQTRDRLAEVLTDPLLAVGLDLEGLEITPAGRRRVLRVAVDRDGGVTLDDVAAATKEISRRLDETDVMGAQPYTLEVTSPGVDRPLLLPRHWRRNEGHLVKVVRTDGETVAGRIVDAEDDVVSLDVDGETVVLPYADVERAHVQIEFNRKQG